MYNAFMYVLENEGINTASVYPYQGTVSGIKRLGSFSTVWYSK